MKKIKEMMKNLTTNYISKKYLFLILLIINVTAVIYIYEDEMRILTVQMKITEFNDTNKGNQNISYDKIIIEDEIININNIVFKDNNMNLTASSSNLILKNENNKLRINLEDIKINNDFLFNFINKIANKNVIDYAQIEKIINRIGKVSIVIETNLNGFVSFEIINDKISYKINYNISLNKNGLLNNKSFLNMFFENKNIVENNKIFTDILEIEYNSLKDIVKNVNKEEKFFNVELINNLFNDENSLFIEAKINKEISISDFANNFIFNIDNNNSSISIKYSKTNIVKDKNTTIQNIQNNETKIILKKDNNISIVEDTNETK